MKVLLIYDSKVRERFRDVLMSMISDAGGQPIEVDAGIGTFDIPKRFDECSREADVVLVDLTVPNTNVGYEIGRFLRRRDHRMILYSFDPNGFPKCLPFYVLQHRCLPVHAVGLKTPEGGETPEGARQRAKFVEQIMAVGEVHQHDPLQRAEIVPASDIAASAMFARSAEVYRAPGVAFLFGEYAVTVGHPALSLPLPRYVYVGITPLPRGKLTRVRYVRTPFQDLDQCDDIKGNYQEMLSATLRALGIPPLDVLVWTQVPTMCGLGTSSAIASCIALWQTGSGTAMSPRSRVSRAVENVVEPGGPMENVFKLAWKIDTAFHSYLGSGAGACASLIGSSAVSPVFYFSEARQTWPGDRGKFPWELGTWEPKGESIRHAHERIDQMTCYGFPLCLSEGPFKRGHFALVYTGHTKSTGSGMANVRSMSRYFLDRPEMLRALVAAVRKGGAPLKYPLCQRAVDEYSQILDLALQVGRTDAAREQHVGALLEILMAGYGCCGLAGANSYWSAGDHSFLPLMEACQGVLEALGVSRIESEDGHVSYEPAQLASFLNHARAPDGSRMFGAKITGGGMGGDVIIASRIEDANQFERELRKSLCDAKDAVDSRYEHFGDVHFSSSWVSGYPESYEAEPTRRLSRQ